MWCAGAAIGAAGEVVVSSTAKAVLASPAATARAMNFFNMVCVLGIEFIFDHHGVALPRITHHPPNGRHSSDTVKYGFVAPFPPDLLISIEQMEAAEITKVGDLARRDDLGLTRQLEWRAILD